MEGYKKALADHGIKDIKMILFHVTVIMTEIIRSFRPVEKEKQAGWRDRFC